MAKFKLDYDLQAEHLHPRKIAVALQTRRNQRRAATQKRTPKCFRSIHSRSKRYSA